MRDARFLTAALAACSLLFAAAPAQAQDEERSDWIDIELGKSVVLDLPRNPTAIAITNPDVANPVSLGVATKIQLQGTALGTTDLVVQYGPSVPPTTYEITVHRDLSDLIRRIDSIVEGEPPRVYPLEERIVVEGSVDDLDTLEQVTLVARLYDPNFVNLMKVRGDHQVQLEVVFAEVSRSGIRQLGLNGLMAYNGITAGMFSPGGFATHQVTVLSAVDTLDAGIVQSPVPGGFDLAANVVRGGLDVGAVLDILDDYKLGKILAQPTLVSLSGQQAEFLAGGEVPVPGPSGQGAVTIKYKPYGIQLVFVPTVLAGNVIDVRVTVEVSEIDPASGTRITGIEIPGFITRKGRSHLRIESGMTFAMAGMLADNTTYGRAGIPGLGRIPIIGALFRTVSHIREETEVVIYVTPRLVRPMAAGEVPAAPGTTENNNPSDLELFLLGVDHRPGSRTASPTGAVGLQRNEN